jgi:hypothetical protein
VAAVQDIQTAIEDGFVRVTYRGVVEYGATTEMLREVGQLAAQRQMKQVLFDIRDADYRNYFVETIRHAQEGSALGIDKGFRIAFVGAEGNPMLQYIEDVSVNRGFQVKTFTEESAALAWLRQAA